MSVSRLIKFCLMFIFMDLSHLIPHYPSPNYLNTQHKWHYSNGKVPSQGTYQKHSKNGGDRSQDLVKRVVRRSGTDEEPERMDDELNDINSVPGHGNYLLKVAKASRLAKGDDSNSTYAVETILTRPFYRLNGTPGGVTTKEVPKFSDPAYGSYYSRGSEDTMVKSQFDTSNSTTTRVRLGLSPTRRFMDLNTIDNNKSPSSKNTVVTASSSKMGQPLIPFYIMMEESKLKNDSRDLDDLASQVRSHRVGDKDAKVRKEKISKEMRSDLADLFMDVGEYLKQNFSLEHYWKNALQKMPIDTNSTNGTQPSKRPGIKILNKVHAGLWAEALSSGLFDIDEHVGSYPINHILKDLVAEPVWSKVNITTTSSPTIIIYMTTTKRQDFGNEEKSPSSQIGLNSRIYSDISSKFPQIFVTAGIESATALGKRKINEYSEQISQAGLFDILKQSQFDESSRFSSKNERHNIAFSVCIQLPIPPLEVLKWNNLTTNEPLGKNIRRPEDRPFLTRSDIRRILYSLDATSRGGEVEDEENDSEAGDVAPLDKPEISSKLNIKKYIKKQNTVLSYSASPDPRNVNTAQKVSNAQLRDVLLKIRHAKDNFWNKSNYVWPQARKGHKMRKRRFAEPEICIKYATIVMHKDCLGNPLVTKIMLAKMKDSTNSSWITKDDLARILMCLGTGSR